MADFTDATQQSGLLETIKLNATNAINMVTTSRILFGAATICRLAMAVLCSSATASYSQVVAPAAPGERATGAPPQSAAKEPQAKGQSCARGRYQGPRPGAVRVTKDRYVWGVTQQFSDEFCMPAEFVSADMNGPLAIAYRVVSMDHEESCGFGDKPGACYARKEHRFEIYYPSGLIPRESDATYYRTPILESSMLLSMSSREQDSARESGRRLNRPGTIQPFRQKFDLFFKAGGVYYRFGSAGISEYYSEIYAGADYLSIDSSFGIYRHRKFKDYDGSPLVLAISKVGEKRALGEIPFAEFPQKFLLPQNVSRAFIENDKVLSGAFEKLIVESR
jgi:hypothetical protein